MVVQTQQKVARSWRWESTSSTANIKQGEWIGFGTKLSNLKVLPPMLYFFQKDSDLTDTITIPISTTHWGPNSPMLHPFLNQTTTSISLSFIMCGDQCMLTQTSFGITKYSGNTRLQLVNKIKICNYKYSGLVEVFFSTKRDYFQHAKWLWIKNALILNFNY